jgi:uncharacterized protein (DUF3084 family)
MAPCRVVPCWQSVQQRWTELKQLGHAATPRCRLRKQCGGMFIMSGTAASRVVCAHTKLRNEMLAAASASRAGAYPALL